MAVPVRITGSPGLAGLRTCLGLPPSFEVMMSCDRLRRYNCERPFRHCRLSCVSRLVYAWRAPLNGMRSEVQMDRVSPLWYWSVKLPCLRTLSLDRRRNIDQGRISFGAVRLHGIIAFGNNCCSAAVVDIEARLSSIKASIASSIADLHLTPSSSPSIFDCASSHIQHSTSSSQPFRIPLTSPKTSETPHSQS